MKKLLAIAVILLVAAQIGYAQKPVMGVGGGIEIAMPIGNFSDVANVGFGLTGRYEYKLNKDVAITGTLGWIHWGGKNTTSYGDYGFTDIPLKGGVKYYFTPGPGRVYGMAELGLHFTSVSWTWNAGYYGYGGSYSASETKFGFAPGVGYEMKIGKNLMLDLSGRFEIVADVNHFALRGGILYILP